MYANVALKKIKRMWITFAGDEKLFAGCGGCRRGVLWRYPCDRVFCP
jgi:hypothetical protein